MSGNDVIIRPERAEDRQEAERLCREAFWNVYRPGCLEHYVLHVLRSDTDFVPELDFVMERAGRLIGQNVFVRAAIRTAGGAGFPIVTMGPIWIAPEFQGRGYGRRLLDYTLARAAERGFSAVCLEGNIGFYGPSGFRFARTFGLRYHGLPAGADDSFFLCRELRPGALAGVTGEYATPPGYLVDEAEAEAFDRAFPPREKRKLPGQLV